MHYLDYAATAPLRPQVRQQLSADMERWADQGLGLNPAALHAMGRQARELLEEARYQIAQILGAEPSEVVFTSGGTESNALAIRGVFGGKNPSGGRVWVGATEHPAVLEQGPILRSQGIDFATLEVDKSGLVSAEVLRAALEGAAPAAPPAAQVAPAAGSGAPAAERRLVSIMSANNETGVINPIKDLAAQAREIDPEVLFHTDAVQAVGRLDFDFHDLGVDLASASGHKIGGPHGIGLLLVRRGLNLHSDRPGGGQESKRRSGTVNVLGARALALALQLACAERAAQAQRLSELGAELRRGLAAQGLLNTAVTLTVDQAPHLPDIIHLTCAGTDPEAVLMVLDNAGVCASAGSACHAGVSRPSPVLEAMGATPDEALGALRISLGWASTSADIAALLQALPAALEAGRALHQSKTQYSH